ncbi:ribosome biogenesis protein rlp24 [Colletotrichum karsti]|uniref:Ribosome biogenesis protein rlp24 n=1 Tax=Colletotrichum karsti TaxID=1095194 RepID=A0A9P6I1J4_9PEZI|nr:ribosome biogenesis protein rlp24 [Colletotrichum karsti]KAF9874102.1 ribosome biogenesis protein rlp24 [Colletotrichum karsti]
MKRNPRKLKWTKAYRASAHKEMTVDSTLQFGARRNVPVRYDRDLVAKTLTAMERVSEIRARRERVFYKKRMAGKRERELAAARKLVAEQGHLLPRLRGSEKKRLAAEGATEDEIAAIEAEGARLSKSKAGKVFGKEKVRQRVTVDGDVVEEREGVVQEGDEEWDDEEGDDDNDDVEMED